MENGGKWKLANSGIARVITEQLLRDFGNKSEFSDWFSREDVAPPIKIIKQPNPKNVEAEKKVVELEVRLKMYVEALI